MDILDYKKDILRQIHFRLSDLSKISYVTTLYHGKFSIHVASVQDNNALTISKINDLVKKLPVKIISFAKNNGDNKGFIIAHCVFTEINILNHTVDISGKHFSIPKLIKTCGMRALKRVLLKQNGGSL